MSEIRVTRANPALIVFMVDMSGSMSEEISYDNKLVPKNEILSRIVNTTLSDIIYRCRSGNEYNDYFNFVVLGYDGGGVTSLLSKYNGEDYISVNELLNADVKKSTYHSVALVDGIERPIDIPIWQFVEIGAMERIPMLAAMTEAYFLGKRWLSAKGANSIPPVFINITDGAATDAKDSELMEMASKIKSLRSSNGNALLMNIHISTIESGSVILFPRNNKGLDVIKNANLLFDMSSELPEWMSKEMSERLGIKWIEGDKYRALGYNMPITQLFDVLQIGSLSL